MKYAVQTGKLTVKARSSVHDTTTAWDKVSGSVDADPDAIEQAKATFTVDMTSFDAGDWLKNRKLRKDFAMDEHPTATFTLDRVSDVQRDGNKFTAKAHGTLRWRGKELVLELAGQGTLDRDRLEARATFVLDIKRLGLQPPKFFMFKMEDEVSVEVSVRGAVQA
ncbi:MAG TPA: YceI family protein [Kofleriaceae bacterium]|nr:YceI family protein [Kofleriaceae bacterium]